VRHQILSQYDYRIDKPLLDSIALDELNASLNKDYSTLSLMRGAIEKLEHRVQTKLKQQAALTAV
tara:strand:- start:14705 stop:14899 length:195 start_codon:yes stop_codon:yes gene_type:complete